LLTRALHLFESLGTLDAIDRVRSRLASERTAPSSR